MGSSSKKTNIKPIGSIVNGTFRSNIVLDSRCRQITDKYEIMKTLGEGKMGIASSARKIKTTYDKTKDSPPSLLVALKSAVMNKNAKHNVEMLRAEIVALKALDHPNCVKVYEIYQTSDHNLHLTLHFCTGGNLYSRFPENELGKKSCFSEKDAAFIISQLLSALAHIHANGIVHRDIKFENIMLLSPDCQIMNLIDFGASTFLSPPCKLCEPIGTTYTMAPEVLRGKYDEKADIWSVGVVCYMMLSLTKPFYGSSKSIIIQKIMKGQVTYYSPNWSKISHSAKSFISSLFTMDIDKRPSAAKALRHPWLLDKLSLPEKEVSDEVAKGVYDSIVQYSEFDDIKKIGLNIMAHQIESNLVWNVRQVFDTHDKNKDCTIKFPDFTAMVRKVNPDCDMDTIHNLFRKVTFDSNSKILHYTEFLAASFGYRKDLVTMDRLWRAFDRLDHDKKGFVPQSKLKELLGSDYNEDCITAIIEKQGDTGVLSFEAFLRLYDSFLQ